jgi:hypothetical protein
MKMTGKLRSLESGGTEVTSVSELGIVGILAQMGGRMIHEVSNIMFQQFTNNFRQMLQSGEGAPPSASPKPISGVGLAFSALKATFTGKDSSSEETGDSETQAEKPADGTGGKR